MTSCESTVEEADLEFLEGLGYSVLHLREISPRNFRAECDEYGHVVLARWMNDARLRNAISGEIRSNAAAKCATGEA